VTVRAMATEGKWRDGGLGERIAKQMCRELLLLESSDWQFLITTEAARDYAEHRFQTHMDQFRILELAWGEFLEKGSLTPVTEKKLAVIEERDNLFAEIDPALWAQRAS
jgi:1,4-alpha-glucan branching enzyme